MSLKLTNEATGLLAANISSAATSISLASSAGAKFPTLAAGDWCPIVVVDGAGNKEIMKCTGRVGDVLTVTRGQEGTVARAFVAGSRVDLRLTAAALMAFADAQAMTLALDSKAPLESPEFAGEPRAPKAPDNDDSDLIATTEWVQDFMPISVGMLVPYDGDPALPPPPRFLRPYGQAISRTTYAAYFAKVGTRHGAGNGTTTFNCIDVRGRGVIGRDTMGGTAAGRVTTAGSGIDGSTMGATGGAQNVTLAIAQTPKHKHNTAAAQEPHKHNVDISRGIQVQTGGSGIGTLAGPIETSPVAPVITVTENEVGGDQPHTNMPPGVVVDWLLYVGV